MSELSSDLFTVLSMENASYVLQKEPVLIAKFLREICLDFYDEAVKKGFVMEIDIPEINLLTELNSKLFRRVIENLLGNALTYNQTGEILSVTLCLQRNSVIIEVTDDGKEISLDQQKTLFDAFSSGDTARSSTEGTGLGLFISKTIVEKHGGKIEYKHSDEKNVFYIHMPCIDSNPVNKAENLK